MTSINNNLQNIGQGKEANTKGITYDRNEPLDALKKANHEDIDITENDCGYFVSVFDNKKATYHMITDRDFDGVFDDYRRNEYDKEKGNWKAYDDYDLDGKFDRTIDFIDNVDNEGGKICIEAIDNDADGIIDSYQYYRWEE